jgi:hypothetical protein
MAIRFTEGDAIPEDVLGFVEGFFRKAIGDLESAMSAITAGKFSSIPKAEKAKDEVAKLARLLIEERARVDKLRKQVAGSVGAGSELDLWAARDEIGRRLACLRADRGD